MGPGCLVLLRNAVGDSSVAGAEAEGDIELINTGENSHLILTVIIEKYDGMACTALMVRHCIEVIARRNKELHTDTRIDLNCRDIGMLWMKCFV